MWQGIRTIKNYWIAPPACKDAVDFLNKLNNFSERFLAEKAVPHQGEKALCLDTADVRRTLKRVNTRKAPTPFLGGCSGAVQIS